jgi:hypothetical protein
VASSDTYAKYARIYKENIAPRKRNLVITQKTIASDRQIFDEYSDARRRATIVGLGGKLADERNKEKKVSGKKSKS